MTANTRLSQIEHATLSAYDKYDVALKKGDEARGRRDGQQDFPSADDDVHHFNQEILGQARSSLRKYGAQLSAYLSELESRRSALTKRLEEGLAVQREQLNDRYQEQRDNIERTIGSSSPTHSALRTNYHDARDRAQEIETQLGRPLRIHLRWFYVPIMILVALCEVPINRFAFELYFSESPLISLGISLTVGMIFALFAHFLGTWLKRSTHYETWAARIGAYCGIALILAIILPTVYVIALMREHYVKFIENTSRSFSDLLQSDSLSGVVSAVASNELSTAGWTLLLLNVIVVTVGAVSSFVRHDAHPDYEGAIRKQERFERKLKKMSNRHEKRTSKAQKEYEAKKETIDKSYRLAMDEVELTKHHISQCEDHRETVVDRIASHLLQRLNSYEYANRKERSDKATPRCFGASEKDLVNELAKTIEDDIPRRSDRIQQVI